MTQHGDYRRRIRDIAQRVADESFAQSERALEIVRELDRLDDAALNVRSLRSVADLRDDDEQARAEHHRLRDGA